MHPIRRPVPILAVAVACYAMAALAFIVSRSELSLPQGRDPQILAVLAGSLVLSVPGVFARSSIAIATLALRLGGVLFLAMALGPATAVITLALIPIVLDCFEIFPLAAGIVVAAVSVAMTVAALAPHSAWGTILKAPPPGQIIFIVFYTLIAGALGAVLKNRRDRVIVREAELLRLEEAVRKLTDANVEYQSYAAFVREESMDLERRRITREIHDIIGYSMTNLLMMIQAALYCGPNDREKVRELLLGAQTHVNESMHEARRSLHRLREQKSVRPKGTSLFLRLAKTFQAMTGVAVHVEFANLPSGLPVRTEKAIYRLLQESMTNAFRHGKATAVEIQFWFDGQAVLVSVSDNGNGATEPLVEGIGIQGMRERIHQLGGSLNAGSANPGFVVHARVPVAGVDDGQN